MELEPEVLAKVCVSLSPTSFNDLAEMLGEESEGFESRVREASPACAAWINRRQWISEMQDAERRMKAGDSSASKDLRIARIEFIKCGVAETMVAGEVVQDEALEEFDPCSNESELDLQEDPRSEEMQSAADEMQSAAMAKPDHRPKTSKPRKRVSSKTIETVVPVPEGMVSGMVLSPLATGISSEMYMDRPVVIFKVPAGGLFGTGYPSRGRQEAWTVVNGITNCLTMKFPNPTPYWSVLDAMSELGSFTKPQVVEKAMNRYPGLSEAPGPDGGKSEARRMIDALSVAFDVLKGHQKHPRKKSAGMAHIVEDPKGGSPMTIRPRELEESLQYFEDDKRRRAEFGEAPLPEKAVDADGNLVEAVSVVVGSPR